MKNQEKKNQVDPFEGSEVNWKVVGPILVVMAVLVIIAFL